MSDMKCPICQTVLDKALMNDKIRSCPKCRNMGNIELWQELIRTRKALDVAVDALGVISQNTEQIDVRITTNKALEQITALEQKDVK